MKYSNSFRKLIPIGICVCISLLTGCAKTVDMGETTTSSIVLKYVYGSTDIEAVLSEEESKQVIDMFDGKVLDKNRSSCGFSKDISITVEGVTYAIACDSCGRIKNCKNNQYFNISAEERNVIEQIFKKYGGKFPCV